MSARRRRALVSAVGAVVVAIVCAALSANLDGPRRAVLLVLTVAWLALAASWVVQAVRTAPPTAVGPATTDEGTASDPG